VRWLNLCGLCLRPGFGYPGDDFRVEQARRIGGSAPQFPGQVQNQIEWWIFWGRIAGGLNRNQQVAVYQQLASTLFPRGDKKPRVNTSLLREMWRAAASLELLPLQTRTELGDAILRRIQSGQFTGSDVWCLSRLGARQLFYGPANQALPPSTASRWLEALLPLASAREAAVSIARRTGDPVRDLSPVALEQVRRALAQRPGAERLLAVLEGEAQLDSGTLDRIFGEELPSGLVFGDERAETA